MTPTDLDFCIAALPQLIAKKPIFDNFVPRTRFDDQFGRIRAAENVDVLVMEKIQVLAGYN